MHLQHELPESCLLVQRSSLPVKVLALENTASPSLPAGTGLVVAMALWLRPAQGTHCQHGGCKFGSQSYLELGAPIEQTPARAD